MSFGATVQYTYCLGYLQFMSSYGFPKSVTFVPGYDSSLTPLTKSVAQTTISHGKGYVLNWKGELKHFILILGGFCKILLMVPHSVK